MRPTFGGPPISQGTRLELICGSCGEATSPWIWLAIDCIERPDLLEALKLGETWSSRSCALCGATTARNEPLLITRWSQSAPIIIAVPEAFETGDEALAMLSSVVGQVRSGLGPALKDVPGPVVAIRMNAVQEVLGCDLERVHVAEVQAQVQAREVARDHAEFLVLVQSTAERRLLERFLMGLEMAGSLADVEQTAVGLDLLHEPMIMREVSARLGDPPNEQDSLLFQAVKELLDGRSAEAWKILERRLRIGTEDLLAKDVRSRMNTIREAYLDRDWAKVILEARRFISDDLFQLVPRAQGVVWHSLGLALISQREVSTDDLREGIKALERAHEWLKGEPQDEVRQLRAGNASNLGVAHGMRRDGDLAVNRCRAIEWLRESVVSLRPTDGDDWAMHATNLALSLLQTDPSDSEFDEAEALLRAAIEVRQNIGEPVSIAFSQLNLAVAFSRRGRHSEAEQLYQETLSTSGLEASGVPHAAEIGALCRHNLARLYRDRAGESGGDEREHWYREAGNQLDRAMTATGRLRAQTVGDLHMEASRLAEALGDARTSAEESRRALAYLTPSTSPRECRVAAWKVASQLESDGDSQSAVAFWEMAVTAARKSLDQILGLPALARELRETRNLFRFAAACIARAGNPHRAVEVIEAGRALEVARTMLRGQIPAELQELDPSEAEYYRALSEKVQESERQARGGRTMSESDVAHFEELHALNERMKSTFGTPVLDEFPSFEQIGHAVPEGTAMAYLLAIPDGFLTLMLTNETGAHISVEARFVDQPTAPDLGLRILLFLSPLANRDAAAFEHFGRDLALALTDPLQELATAASRTGCTELCLVPVGTLALLPLHTLPIGGRDSLIDSVAVSFAPSALVRRRSIERGARAVPSGLLIVGNPLPHGRPLPGAEFEARAVAKAMHNQPSTLLVGKQATRAAVTASFRGRRFLHFACHGSADFLGDPLSGGLSLANEVGLSASEIAGAELQARLTVLSACESGVVQGPDVVDEVLSTATAFLMAGSAGVVATFWAVDDLSTAVMMCHFYETLASGVAPVHALRAAQLWARSLTDEELEAYVLSREDLERMWRTRSESQLQSEQVSRLATWGAFYLLGC